MLFLRLVWILPIMMNVLIAPVTARNIFEHPGATAVKQLLEHMWREEDGVLSFEWTMLTSLLTIGVVSGVAAVRDAAIDEMGDLAQAMLSLDQSYVIQPPLAVGVHTVGGFGGGGFGFSGGFGGWGGGVSSAASSVFIDAMAYQDCTRLSMKVQEFPRRNTQPMAPPAAEGQPMPATPAL
jgi:Flp pilus assembly pilin Flp